METFSALLAICARNSPVTGEFPHKGQWRGVLMFSLICSSTNGWINKGEAGDLRRHHAHYDVIVMKGGWKPVSYFVMWRFVAQNPTHNFVPVYSYIHICTHQLFEMFRKVMCSFRNMILCKIYPKWFAVYNMNTVFIWFEMFAGAEISSPLELRKLPVHHIMQYLHHVSTTYGVQQ